MLKAIEGSTRKKEAQRRLQDNLKGVLPSQGVKNIGFPGGNADHIVYSRGIGSLWYAPSGPNRDNRVPRYWNSFGIYQPDAGAQIITVEANIPSQTNSGWVAGFFAEDEATGAAYLMHSGKVGGGGEGIGKKAFLAWANPVLEDVGVGEDRYRSAIVLGNLDSRDLADRIWFFVQEVAEFKKLAKTGQLSSRAFKKRVALYQAYSREFSGRKRGRRNANIDYVTYHGDVVDALAADRKSTLKGSQTIVKTRLIDLGVAVEDNLVELYEVKTSCDRQSLYAALGQIITHAVGAKLGLKRFLVLPADEKPASDIDAAIRELGIEVRTFRRSGPLQRPRIVLDPL